MVINNILITNNRIILQRDFGSNRVHMQWVMRVL